MVSLKSACIKGGFSIEERNNVKRKKPPLNSNRVTFGDIPGSSLISDDNESITRPPNYSSAVPVKWSQIRPKVPSNIHNQKETQSIIELDAGKNYSQSDPLGIFPTRNDTEQFGGPGSIDIRDKYPQLFLANHLAQLRNNEQYNNDIQQHHSSSSTSLQVIY